MKLPAGVAFALLLVAQSALASPRDDAIAHSESVPGRPLVVRPGHTQHYVGLGVDLSSPNPGETWDLPLGGGFGLTRNLEIGLDVSLLLSPWSVQNVLSTIRLYGRYLLIPERMALEAAFHVATAESQNLGIEVTAPARFKIGPVEIMAQGRFLYRGAEAFHQLLFGVAASGLYTVVDRFFVIVDLGFALNPLYLDLPIGSEWTTDVRLPIAIGAGYEIMDDLFVKGVFGFNDLATESGAFDQRFFQVTLVQAFNLSGEPEPATGANDDGTPVVDPLAVPALEGIPEKEPSAEGETTNDATE